MKKKIERTIRKYNYLSLSKKIERELGFQDWREVLQSWKEELEMNKKYNLLRREEVVFLQELTSLLG